MNPTRVPLESLGFFHLLMWVTVYIRILWTFTTSHNKHIRNSVNMYECMLDMYIYIQCIEIYIYITMYVYTYILFYIHVYLFIHLIPTNSLQPTRDCPSNPMQPMQRSRTSSSERGPWAPWTSSSAGWGWAAECPQHVSSCIYMGKTIPKYWIFVLI